jgi:hypothetical protein
MAKRLTNYDWTRKLSKPVDLGGPRKLRTLHDVLAHLANLPPDRHEWPAVQHIARLIHDAAEGKDVGDITIPMQMARSALFQPAKK